ncbi:histidinol-phosphatase [Jeongeupella avenae]|uniref:Histidinol-phosphatase n=1 Tax=Antarcticirhabdus aurantiaca TaxID=2606717 RepID=A0ACD4NUG9_9HYPH|nr:histidinol-phosphatase [Antarcticirhabdus aurantiaca]WAJ30532.1 histidinol-phosphatase [Jeongeuplla avenae]
MSDIDVTAALLHRLADAADAETLPRFRRSMGIDNKRPADFDPVTEGDREAERAIRRVLAETRPDDGILGEEFGATGDSTRQWVIDPIDGTRVFISGVPVWGTLIGYYENGRARAGIMSQPFTGERFWGDGREAQRSWRGETAALQTRATETIEAATLFTTSPRLFKDEALGRFEALEARCRLTRFGTDCYAFAMLASGFADIVVEGGLQPYDIAALIPIIEQAGGVVTTTAGGRAEAGGDVVASANPRLHEAVLRIVGA